jgi:Fe-S-cluster containining protein
MGGLYDRGFLVENWGATGSVARGDSMTQSWCASSNECDCCGACCRTFPIVVSIGDAQREPRIEREARKLPEWQRSEDWEYQLHPLPFLNACPFLGLDNRCSVYSTRPEPCRRFRAGSSDCNEARARVGLRPLGVRVD